MTLRMPEPDAAVVSARAGILAGLRRILQDDGVIGDDE